ncbi:MAG TPA: hypothetical protein PKC76_18970 [Saprospiraceae bacterium]|nr:hypothetical protein [Saprospiraceae bacterium]HMP26219.1 hypothetical protein [Saprospiraceae bacterium]
MSLLLRGVIRWQHYPKAKSYRSPQRDTGRQGNIGAENQIESHTPVPMDGDWSGVADMEQLHF